jgi:hypothetical protein
MLSKAFSGSENTAAVSMLLLKCGVVHKTHTFKCRAVTGIETKLTVIKRASFLNRPLDNFLNTFLEYLACCGQEAHRT